MRSIHRTGVALCLALVAAWCALPRHAEAAPGWQGGSMSGLHHDSAPRASARIVGFGGGAVSRRAYLRAVRRVHHRHARGHERHGTSTIIVRREVPVVIGIRRTESAQPVIFDIVTSRPGHRERRLARAGRDRAGNVGARIVQVRVPRSQR